MKKSFKPSVNQMKRFIAVFITISLSAGMYAQTDEYGTMSQQEGNVEINSRDIDSSRFYYPNTTIPKKYFSSYTGIGVPHTSGTLTDCYNRKLDFTMSFDYYHYNNLTFSLYIMFAVSHLKRDVNINDKLWTPNDTLSFHAFGFSVGYSVLNTAHWKINPFGGLASNSLYLASASGDHYNIGLRLSPVIGINFSYRIINMKKAMQRNKDTDLLGFIGINTKIAYVPFAVKNRNVPFSGGIWYMTIGITTNDN